MRNKFIEENIQLLKDWMRGLFALFLLVGTGVATLWGRQTFISYNKEGNILIIYNIDYYTIILGITAEIIIITLILIFNKKIRHFIKSLKQ